jgi:hypothetical protein
VAGLGLILALSSRGELSAGGQVAARCRVAPIELPEKSDGRRELGYAFGKQAAPTELAEVARRALSDRELFDAVIVEGPADVVLHLRLSRARSNLDDLSGWESRGSRFAVSADVAWEFRGPDGEALASGLLPERAEVELRRAPRKADVARAWSLLVDAAAPKAFAEALAAAAFGNAPPAPGGWISDG